MRRFISRPQSLEFWLKICLAIAVSIFVFNLAANRLRVAGNEWAYNDDQKQQIFEFYSEGGSQLFEGDYISEYYENAFLPTGYLMVYDVAGFVGDPFFFSKILSMALMLAFVFLVFLISRQYAGLTWGLFSVLLIFCTSLFFDRMDGGLPRAFAFPLGALFFLGFVRGKVLWCAYSLILMALFYPPLLMPYSIVFAVWVLFPRLMGTEAAPLPGLSPMASGPRRFLWLSMLGVLIVLIMVPTVYKSREYGERIMLSDINAFPEAGNNGRYSDEDRVDGDMISELSATVLSTARMVFDGTGRVKALAPVKAYVLFALLCACIYGLYGRKALAGREIRFLLALSFAAVTSFAISMFLYPYAFLPQRSITYTLPFIAHFLLLFGLVGVSVKLGDADGDHPKRWRMKSRGYFPVVMAAVLICSLVGKPPATVVEDNHDLYKYLRYDLPQDALLAGWPDYTVDGVPLFSRKRILVGVETYQAFHKGYVLEMRKRGLALVDAYLSDDPQNLKRLRDEFGVRYLLVKLSHFKGKKVNIPAVFIPIKDYTSSLISRVPRNKSAVWRLMPSLEIKRIGGYSVLDLGKL